MNQDVAEVVSNEHAVKERVKKLAEAVAWYARKIGLKQSLYEVGEYTYRLSFGDRDLVVVYKTGEEKPAYHLHFGEKVRLKKVDVRPLPFAMVGDAIDALAGMKTNLEKTAAEARARADEWLKKLEGVSAPEV